MLQKLVLNAALNLLQSKFIDNILHDEFKAFVEGLKYTLVRSIDIVVDNNPNNREQFAELWEQLKGEVKTDSLTEAAVIINNEVKDFAIRDALVQLIKAYQNDVTEKKMMHSRAKVVSTFDVTHPTTTV